MIEGEIFESKAIQTHENYPIIYSDDIKSDNYVDQFLNICQVGVQKSYQEEYRYPQIQDIKYGQDEECVSSHKKNQQKSAYHNFQKHLVTTLRNNIKINDKTFPEEHNNIEKKLWKCFMQCVRPTRTLIFLITGGIDLQTFEDKNIQKLYGIHKIIRSYPSYIVEEAQKSLREEILYQTDKLDLEWVLNNRRMKNKKGFKIYFNTFCEELRAGKCNRRIPKNMKLHLQQLEQQKRDK